MNISSILEQTIKTVIFVFMLVVISLWSHHVYARASFYSEVVVTQYSEPSQINTCGVCHGDWGGKDSRNNFGIQYYLYTGAGGGFVPAALQALDSDGDGVSNDAEMSAGTASLPGYPDKDGDGYIAIAYRGDGNGMPLHFHNNAGGDDPTTAPLGYDIDDNNAAGGNYAWQSAPPASYASDTTAPAQVTDLRAGALSSAQLNVQWTAPGDDGSSGTAHSYDLRYITESIATTHGYNVRDPAHWATMWNVADCDVDKSSGHYRGGTTIACTGNWNSGNLAPLMRVINEANPSAAGSTDSHSISSFGSTFTTNVIADGTTYWLALRSWDGVFVPNNFEGHDGFSQENLSPVSNIIAVTAGVNGTGISTIGTTTAPNNIDATGIVITGVGLDNIDGVQLSDASGTVVSTINSSITTPGASSITVTLGILDVAAGTYTLELTSSGTVKAAWVNAFTVTVGAEPAGGYIVSNVIPVAQISQSVDGLGIITVNWKARDDVPANVTLNTFEYSVDGGSSWNAPTNGDSSASLSSNWNNNGGGGWSTATTLAAATAHSFTFDTQHGDTSGLAGVDQSDVKIRFKLNDGTNTSLADTVSDNFTVDNLAPTPTMTSASYLSGNNTLTITGSSFLTIAAATSDIKAYVDWSKFVWDINGDDATTANISFVIGDVSSLTIVNDTTMNLVFTSTMAAAIESNTDYGAAGGADTMDISAGYIKDAGGNVATTDAVADGVLAIDNVTISGTVYSDQGITKVGAGLSIVLLVEGVNVGSDTTDANGDYSITPSSFNLGDAFLVFIDQDATNGTTVSLADGAAVSGVDIYGNAVIARKDSGAGLTNINIKDALGAYADNDIIYTISGNDLVINDSVTLYVPGGHVYAPGTNTTADNYKILGTLSGGSSVLSVKLDWNATGGTIIPGTSTVKFLPNDITFVPGNSSYHHITLDSGNSNNVTTLGGNLNIDGDLTITAGDLDVSTSNYSINVAGNFSNSDTFTARSGTVVLDGTGQTISGPNTFYNLTKSVTSADTLTFAAGSTQTINNVLTLNGASGQLLSLRSATPASTWGLNITAAGSHTTSYLDVKDSDASSSDAGHKPLQPINSVDSGNNTAWFSPAVGGYTADNIIPAAQISQSADGLGAITINWKARDAETDNVSLNTFEYSVDGGTTWIAPGGGDSSAALAANWNDNGGSNWSTATTLAAATAHSFTFDTQHALAPNMDAIDQSDVKVRFTVHDGSVDSVSVVTSESFRVDNLAPTSTISNGLYDPATDTLTLTGTNFLTLAAATTDIKANVNWSRFVWDINGDNATTADITFGVGDVTSFTVTNDTTLTLVFTGAKGTAIEATTDYGGLGGNDTLDITSGFLRDEVLNAATTDNAADAILAFTGPDLRIVKSSLVISDPVNNTTNPIRIPGAVIEYTTVVSNYGTESPDNNTVYVTTPVDTVVVKYDVTTGVTFTDGATTSALALATVSFADEASPGPYVYDYTPVADGEGYDAAVTSIKIETTGTFANGGSPAPSFSVKFRVKIK